MKQKLQRIFEKIDAYTLRERVIIFVTAALALLFLVNMFLIEPQFQKQKKLTQKITDNQAKIAEIQTVIQQKLVAHSIDPDNDNRIRLQNLKQQHLQAKTGLVDLQKGLISPEKMTSFLDDILRRHGRLRLTSLKTLPVVLLNDAMSGAERPLAAVSTAPVLLSLASGAEPRRPNAAAATVPAAAPGLEAAIYQHGVEINVQGSYPDMLQYMSELEAMPWQLFWSKAKLTVDEYPKATLTLTLFTLSLDKKWLNL